MTPAKFELRFGRAQSIEIGEKSQQNDSWKNIIDKPDISF
jgi:hypothetical protein